MFLGRGVAIVGDRDKFLQPCERGIGANLRYWCISTSTHNCEICKKNSVWGMDARYFVTLKKFLKAGDKAVVYKHGGKFVAVVEFVGEFFYSEKDLGWKKNKKSLLAPYRIAFRMIHEAHRPREIYFSTEERGNKARWSRPNLIDNNITFVADRGRAWNQYVQVSVVRITEEDFRVISEAIMSS